MPRTATLSLALVLFALAGCSSVVSVHKLGQPAAEEVGAKLDGVWVTDDGSVHLKHLSGGELIAAGLSWKEDPGQFVKDEARVWLTTDDGVFYVNLLQEQEEDQTQPPQTTYAFLRCAIEDERIVLYGPRPEYFAKVVEAGGLEGTVRHEENTVHAVIAGDAAKFTDLVHPDRVGEQFNIDSPIILRKLGDL